MQIIKSNSTIFPSSDSDDFEKLEKGKNNPTNYLKMLQISLIRPEGIPDSCELFIQGETKSFSCSLCNSEFAVTKGSSIRINIINSSDKSILCSSCFSTDLLPIDDFQWLPFSYNLREVFKNLSIEVKKPRLLVYIAESLSPVKELPESEESENLIEDCLQIKHSKNSFFSTKNLEFYKSKYEESIAQTCSLKLQLKKLTEDFEEHKTNAKLREEFLENLLNEKIKEGKKLVTLETRNSSSPDCEKENRCLLKTKEKSAPQSHLRIKSVEINKRTPSEHSERTNQKSTHQALQEFMKKNKISPKITKETDNLYLVCGRKVFLTLKNGKLLCRVGGGFEHIEDFIKKNSSTRLTSHRRVNTASSAASLQY